MERSLGRVLSERGTLKEARALLESATGRAEALRKKDARLAGVRPFLGLAYRDLAQALGRAGEAALAAEARRKAEAFRPEPFGPGKGRGGPR
jgi:hypothetical protein